MSKYPCGLIEDLMPLYVEGDVSHETKEIVEEHLKECKNCRALLKEYSDDEIKLDQFKEDLPKADTFKKWMKRLKLWGSITVILAILISVGIGALGYKIGERPKNDLLTLKTIIKTFEKQGLLLKEDKSKSPDEFDLKGIKPVIFTIGDSKDTLLIYTFKSFVERQEIVRESSRFNNSFSIQEIPYNAKNALIVYIPFQTPKTEEEMEEISKTNGLISDTVFKYLNDGKEIVYKGESASWEGTFTLKYYEHWWQDETGKLNYESYNMFYPEIKYKKPDIEAVGPIDFEYKSIASGMRQTGEELNKDGILRMGGGGGNGAMPRENDDINFTIRWDGKEESFVLKAK